MSQTAGMGDREVRQRERNVRNCRLYYQRHTEQFLKHKVLGNVRRVGSVPMRGACGRLGIRAGDVVKAYTMYCADNAPSEQSRRRYEKLLGSWT